MKNSPPFAVVTGSQIAQALVGQEKAVTSLVEETYRRHGEGDTVNPPSYFLRFPDRPESRIIALPASVGGSSPVDGLKWISSFPRNIEQGLPRASAALLLNNPANGYPFALLEGSIISAVRTAASAALAAERLSAARSQPRPTRVGFIGTGLIARYIHTYLAGNGWEFDEVGVFDLAPQHAESFAGYLARCGGPATTVRHETAEDLIRASDLIVFATVAGAPHVHDAELFAHNPLVLGVSLRDLDPAVILASANIVDDVEHCLKAGTSVHLTEQQTGGRDFLDGTLYDVLLGHTMLPGDRPVVFSPFGLGVLDLAVGKWVYDRVREGGGLTYVDDFFHELDRYGS
ncbi:2,3-diaminopropionate biosynthesis protein SbnB [Dactylosporangium vinaceum]|uniref:2,3-diaminopropionate biosynthesis protein SbnB n=1 Tax=Dactylosporangium vinaceum TaxID=53362 RepID=A0ABV5ML70_9ACTN|nr:2,3-diaminopropionate biosynthesis protein SbnB [Dactylosporangium vinaceum]UAB94050.1 2,3-diaminopropionate biosynthesis protein SbnB [Dactylosporangium vinaceum]